jgi:hypothetical protein
VNTDHQDRIKALEDEIKALKETMLGMGTSSGNDSNLDSAQIIMRINMLSIEVNKKIDIIVCNH